MSVNIGIRKVSLPKIVKSLRTTVTLYTLLSIR